MGIKELLDNKMFIILVSLLWGFGIAIMFKKTCQNDNCVVVKVPPEFAMNNNIIRDNNRCYQLHKYPSECVY